MGEQGRHDCEEAVHAVYTYLDGELNSVERTRVSVHLRRCRGCADAVEFERAFLLRIRQACPEPPPQDLIDKVRALLRQAMGEQV